MGFEDRTHRVAAGSVADVLPITVSAIENMGFVLMQYI